MFALLCAHLLDATFFTRQLFYYVSLSSNV